MEKRIDQWKQNRASYLIEAGAIGLFMISASLFTILFEHPNTGLSELIPSPVLRRACIGVAMGLTAILLIYSKWGQKSGAHMNPAVTLANFQLDRIDPWNTAWYILAQTGGALVGIGLVRLIAFSFLSAPSVNYIATVPGSKGPMVALFAEFLLSFLLFLVILIVNNSRFAKYTGYIAGFLIFVFILVEAPVSGMSMNPARSLAPALIGQVWDSLWVYFLGPVWGMQTAAFIYRRWYLHARKECKSMNVFMSGSKGNNTIYSVRKWFEVNSDNQTIIKHP